MSIRETKKKFDSDAILRGRPLYTKDLAPKDCLHIVLLRSPHPHAKVKCVDASRAEKLEGFVAVYTYDDVPKEHFTLAGQSYPEPSPYDRLIINDTMRFVGDVVAMVVAEDEATARRARDLIKVDYEILPACLDPEKATEGPVIHPEHPFIHLPQPVGHYDFDKNIVGEHHIHFGEDVEDALQKAEVLVDEVYHTQAQAQAMMETFRAFATLDQAGRLVVTSSTQVPFHIKRQLARALSLPPSKVRVIKPRIGGAFGAKQTSEAEVFPAFVTLKTGRPSMIVYDRKETFMATNTRHAARLRVRLGATKEGEIEAIAMDVLSDQGAYGIHAWTTLKLMGEKAMPLYNKVKAAAFDARVVYTNKQPAGAFRGYGATQGCFALESAVNELARRLAMDPLEIRKKNILKEGERTLAFDKEIRSCALDRCLEEGARRIDWETYRHGVEVAPGVIRSAGMAISMQGSGIAAIDTANAELKLNEEGDYNLFVSCTDAGTGTDTIMLQLAAEVLMTDVENIAITTADTDLTPYDPGSYASSGVYTTGNAVVNCAEKMVAAIKEEAAKIFQCTPEEVEFDGTTLTYGDNSMTLKDMATKRTVGMEGCTISTRGSFGNDDSPPPYMAGFALVDTDTATGEVKVKKYVGIVDCGTVMNPNLARVQTEGGIVQGIGLALYEKVDYSPKGAFQNNSFASYTIPTRPDIGELDVDFCESYEPTGPFGAKSIGEIVINTPSPAIAAAVSVATKTSHRSLPITCEEVLLALENR